MSRANVGAPIVVKASSNIYTALAGTAVLATLAAVVVLVLKYNQLGWDLFRM